MDFKSSEQLIARVSKQLNSYQAAGLLDEGDFYRWIKEILTKLNVPTYSEKHNVITMKGNYVPVPDDMYQLWAAWRYEEQVTPSLLSGKHYQRQTRWKVEERQCLEHGCDDNCNDIYKEGDIIVVKEFIENSGEPYTRRLINGVPIRILNYETNQCSPDSPVLKCATQMTGNLSGNKIVFNFTGGSIYLQYYKMMLDDDGLPMIPNVTEIELAIETYIVYRFFQELYYNTTVDVLQRMQYAEVQYVKAFDIAKSWIKLPTARSFIDAAIKRQGHFKRFELKHSRE